MNYTFSQLYLSFDGRVSRSTFWIYGVLILTGVAFLGLILDMMMSGEPGMLYIIIAIATLIPSLAMNVKRCHDRDHSGWFLLIALIPIIGSIWLLIELGFLAGTPGDNGYGPDPLSQVASRRTI